MKKIVITWGFRLPHYWASVRKVFELQCFKEEAESRLMLHAVQASGEEFQAMMADQLWWHLWQFVVNPAFAKTHLLQKTGTCPHAHLLAISKITASPCPDVCKAVIGMHAYTGCNTVSAFNVQYEYSESWEFPWELFKCLESFIYLWY